MPEPQNQIGSIRVKKANWNLPAPILFEEAVRRGEGRVAVGGSLVVATGKHTGRAANDKFIVRVSSKTRRCSSSTHSSARTPSTAFRYG